MFIGRDQLNAGVVFPNVSSELNDLAKYIKSTRGAYTTTAPTISTPTPRPTIIFT